MKIYNISASNRQAGVSLISTVVALAVLACIMYILSGSIGSILETWKDSQRAFELESVRKIISIQFSCEQSFPASKCRTGSQNFTMKNKNGEPLFANSIAFEKLHINAKCSDLGKYSVLVKRSDGVWEDLYELKKTCPV